MKTKLLFLLLVYGLWSMVCSLGFAEGKISGQVFGDFFWYAKNHNETLEDNTGFWIRRGYFTYDHTFDEHFSGRFRLEVNSPDLTRTTANTTPYLKEASVKWKPNRHAVLIGLIPTPTWPGVVEDHWGYRAVEKTPLDLQRLGSAVDLGVGIRGALDEAERFGYHLMVGNGAGTRSETNSDKKVIGALWFKPFKEWVLQIYGDTESGNNNNDRNTFYGFSGYTKENWRAGLLFAYRIQQANAGSRIFKILSGYGAGKIVSKVWAYLRVDRMFDPNTDGNNIDYLPFDTTSESTFLLAGADYEPVKNLHFMPNLETVFYDTVGGRQPGTDLVPRMTFYWEF